MPQKLVSIRRRKVSVWLEERPAMTMEELRDAMDSVSKDNFNEFESTEWTAVFDLSSGEAHYYHRENYDNRFTFVLY